MSNELVSWSKMNLLQFVEMISALFLGLSIGNCNQRFLRTRKYGKWQSIPIKKDGNFLFLVLFMWGSKNVHMLLPKALFWLKGSVFKSQKIMCLG